LAARDQVRRLSHARPIGSLEDPATYSHRARLVLARQVVRSVQHPKGAT
jgi:hypothetical protein